MDAAEVVNAYWQRVWGDGDLGVLDDLIASDYRRHAANGTARRSIAGLREDLAGVFRSLRVSTVAVEDQAVAGDRVWTRLTVRAVDVENEVPRVYSWLHVARVEGGRIAETWQLNTPLDWSK